MKKAVILAVSCALAFPAVAFAQSAQTKVAPTREVRKVPPVIATPRSGILRQDLFGRNNPNNLRSDWPSPPAQPAQF